MNKLLQLKGTFHQKANKSMPGPLNVPKYAIVEVNHLRELRNQLNDINTFWNDEKYLNGMLVSVQYKDVIAKSRRIKGFLSKGKQEANDSIVGAKFIGGDKKKHVITHYISNEILNETISRVNESIKIIDEIFHGKISFEEIENVNKNKIELSKYDIKKTIFVKIIVDAFYIEKLKIPECDLKEYSNSLITIYKTDTDTRELLSKIGIDIFESRVLDSTTIYLSADQLKILVSNAPYLIAMSTCDLSKLSYDCFVKNEEKIYQIEDPNNEPVIGVIDTLFDTNVYFSKWVTTTDKTDNNIPVSKEDYYHGTEVTSIIVDGPQLNPKLDDGCGRFRVKHFAVARASGMSSFTILKLIKEIIAENRDIHVWNLSLGSDDEINENFISVEGSFLDNLQFDNNIIFVVSGTNSNTNKQNKKLKKIGAPADSINSIVVNAVDMDGNAASYSREGTVLSFFNKPDICYYGGDKNEKMIVCSPDGVGETSGTSFAAPWISRKLSYLIDILGFSREVAKALLIDSATSWDKVKSIHETRVLGYGIVPIKIRDIVETPKDEIKFVISGQSDKYDTYNYNIPVPIYNNQYPYIAKAILCYFPSCSRNQGVDYTNTELDIYFGRVRGDSIKSINENKQSLEGIHYLKEENARLQYRKWDNVKYIGQVWKGRIRGKEVYKDQMWGISIKTKERLNNKDGKGIKFGMVITLREINGVNRIEEFINQCLLKGWLVKIIDIENKIDIYNKAEEEIKFE